jgi:alpha-L-fucosidase 2
MRVPNTRTHILHLLPALPDVWPAGSFTGLRARGGFTVDIAWENAKLTNATIHSKLGGPVQIKLGDKTIDLDTEAGKTYTITGELEVAQR